MSFIKNQFFEKKITQLLKNYKYVLIFHYNNITSKEWISLKKNFFQINPFIQSKVVPNRFLFQLLKNLKLNKISFDNSQNEQKDSLHEQIEPQENQFNLGSSCLFFCSNQNDLKKITKLIEQFGIGGIITQGTQASNSERFNTLKFINIGMIEMSPAARSTRNPTLLGEQNAIPSTSVSSPIYDLNLQDAVAPINPCTTQLNYKSMNLHRDLNKLMGFWCEAQLHATYLNFYDIKKFLELNSNTFLEFHNCLNKNNNLIIQFEKSLNFSNVNFIAQSAQTPIFKIHHNYLLNILSILQNTKNKGE